MQVGRHFALFAGFSRFAPNAGYHVALYADFPGFALLAGSHVALFAGFLRFADCCATAAIVVSSDARRLPYTAISRNAKSTPCTGSASLVVSGKSLQKLLDNLVDELAVGASLYLRHQSPHQLPHIRFRRSTGLLNGLRNNCFDFFFGQLLGKVLGNDCDFRL